METKLLFALCALLVTNLGSAVHDQDHVAPTGSALNTEAGAPSLNSTSQPGPALNNSNTTAGKELSVADNNNTLTTQPPESPFKSQATASHSLRTSTPTSPPHTAHTPPVNTTNATVAAGTVSQQPLQPETSSSASAPKQTGTAKPETTTATNTSTRSTPPASSTSSPKERPSPGTQTLTSPRVAQPDTTQARARATNGTTGIPSTLTKAHPNTPSQLNVGGDSESMMVHKSPTLDPLLAGLVSAFIITAVIITLLLFLKLRRRDNQPEFRRLQDLPMDDMMEDTPLSMYTY